MESTDMTVTTTVTVMTVTTTVIVTTYNRHDTII